MLPEALEDGPKIDIDLYSLNNGTLKSNNFRLVALPDGGAIVYYSITRPGTYTESGLLRVSPNGLIESPPLYNSSQDLLLGINYDEENDYAIPLHWNGRSPLVPLEEPHEIVKTHNIPNMDITLDCDVVPVSFLNANNILNF